MLWRGLFALALAVGAAVFAYRLPSVDVDLFGEDARGLFVLHSAALPLLLLLFVSWVEEARTAVRVTVAAVAVGGSAGTTIRLTQELFSGTPVIWFPIVEPVLPESLWDERIWLVLNAMIGLIITIAMFTSGGDAVGSTEEEPPPTSANGHTSPADASSRGAGPQPPDSRGAGPQPPDSRGAGPQPPDRPPSPFGPQNRRSED